MPIFTKSLQRIEYNNPQESIKKMANHIKYIQEQLEFTLHNLDSQHITEINTDSTTITDSSGSINVGSFIYLKGQNGESFTVGKNPQGQFEFAVKGKSGKQTMYLNSSGELIITEHTHLTVDGGEW
jgi:hypothetical protein